MRPLDAYRCIGMRDRCILINTRAHGCLYVVLPHAHGCLYVVLPRAHGCIFYSHGSSNSKGVMILVKDSLEFECKEAVCDSHGRYIILKCLIQGQIFMLCNSYAPTDEKEHF